MDQRSRILAAIAAQEELRATLGDETVDLTINALRTELDRLETAAPQRRLATVLFADISGFTAWGEERDAEIVADTIDEVWSLLDRIVVEHNGRVDKHIGDALMAVWGSGASREDDAENAIRAGLALAEAFSGVAPSGAGDPPLALRVGINTGTVAFRQVGTAGEYTAMGDTVNVAARLEAAAPAGQVLISHETYRHARGVFTVTEQPALTVKGKQEPIHTYVVAGERPRAFRLENRGIEGLEARMFGRERELDALQTSFRSVVEDRRSQLVTIVGDAGIGKSRLVYEFLDWLQLLPEEVFLWKARSDPQLMAVPYALIKDLFSFRFEIALDDPEATVVEKLVAGFAAHGGDERAAHRVAHLIGFDMSQSRHLLDLMVDPQLLRDEAESAVRTLLSAMADESPVVVVLEDAHWADRASLALVRTIATQVAGGVLVVASARPELFAREPGWQSVGRLVELANLSASAAEEQVRDLLRLARQVPDGLIQHILEGGAGNPFYVEEMIKTLIESGRITTTLDEWEIHPDAVSATETPPSLRALLQARIDAIPTSQSTALQIASVVGRTFWDDVVGVVGHHAVGDDELRALVGRELVLQAPETSVKGCVEYLFRHSVLRDVVYDGVLLSNRRAYHRAVADWLIATVETESWAAVIGEHLVAAGDSEAGAWFVRAGTHARARFANDEALSFFERALESDILSDEDRFAAYDGLGEVLMVLARYEEASDAHRTMRDLARDRGNRWAEAKALTGIVFAESRISSTEALAATAEEAVTTARSLDPPDNALLCEALRGAGWVLLRAGDLGWAMDHAEEAAAVADASGDLRQLSLSLNLLSLVESTLGRFLAAEGRMEQAVAIDRRLGNRRDESTSLLNLGESARLRGAFDKAATRYLAALEIAQELGDRDTAALSRSNLGGAYVGLGQPDQALAVLEPALAEFRSSGRMEYVSETMRFLAEAHLALADTETALEWAHEALAAGRVAGNPEQVGHAWRVIGAAVARTGEPADVDGKTLTADDCFRRALDVFDTSALDRALVLLAWADATVSANRDRAISMRNDALEILRPLGLESLGD